MIAKCQVWTIWSSQAQNKETPFNNMHLVNVWREKLKFIDLTKDLTSLPYKTQQAYSRSRSNIVKKSDQK